MQTCTMLLKTVYIYVRELLNGFLTPRIENRRKQQQTVNYNKQVKMFLVRQLHAARKCSEASILKSLEKLFHFLASLTEAKSSQNSKSAFFCVAKERIIVQNRCHVVKDVLRSFESLV